MSDVVNLNLSNTYGNVTAIKNDDGKCYLLLDDYGSTDSLKISERLFLLIKEELG